MHETTSIIVGMLAWTTLSACASGGGGPRGHRPDAGAAPSHPIVGVVFVPEMEPLPGIDERETTMTSASRAAFDAAWARVRPSVAGRVTGDEIVAASRWAREQTRGFAPDPGWIDSMPMEPIGASGGSIVVGQRAETSPVVLPTHAAVVHRRLIVAAVFDPARGAIDRVFVTIRGWAEE